MWKKRVLSLLLALAVWAGLAVTASAAEPAFPDVPGSYWAYDAIGRFARRGVINGKPDGTFAPDEAVTREQFAKMMALAFYLPIPEVIVPPYADVPADSWAAPYIAACREYINADADGSMLFTFFRPQAPATREEVAAALLRVMEPDEPAGFDPDYAKAKFSDADAITPAMLPYVSCAAQLGLVTGYPDGTFGPQKGVTRAEAAALLERALGQDGAGETGVALRVGDHDLSVADMDYYYHQALNDYSANEQYMAQLYTQFGMEYEPTFDASVDPREQYVDDEQTQTFHDYFKEQAKEGAAIVYALSDAALAAGYTISPEGQVWWDEDKADLSEDAERCRYTRSGYLKAIYGPNVTVDVYFQNVGRSVLGADYFSAVTTDLAACTDADLEAYYAANPDALDSYDYTYAYFDGMPQEDEDAEGDPIPALQAEKDAAMARAKENAETLYGKAEGGRAVDFADLAEKLGGYGGTHTGEMGANFSSEPYAEWLTDAARKDGDTDTFEAEGAGFYVIRFHKRYLDNDSTKDVRHILISTDTEDGPATQEQIAEAKAQAQAILDEFNAGEKTAEAFGALAEEHSADGRDGEGKLYAPGGLYERIERGEMVQPFEDWCFDPARKAGDTGLVQTDYGWSVMYFQGNGRPAWMDKAADGLHEKRVKAFREKALADCPAREGPAWGQVGLER